MSSLRKTTNFQACPHNPYLYYWSSRMYRKKFRKCTTFNIKNHKLCSYIRNTNQCNLLDLGTPQTILKRKVQQQSHLFLFVETGYSCSLSRFFFSGLKKSTTIFNNLSSMFLIHRLSNMASQYLEVRHASSKGFGKGRNK